jgi:uroporphyrinogen decarboxylase
MSLLPLKKPQPDIEMFIGIITGKIKPKRPPVFDLKVSRTVMEPIVKGLLSREWVDFELLDFPALSHAKPICKIDRVFERKAWDNFIAFWYHMGYDSCRIELGMAFPRIAPGRHDKTLTGERKWADLSEGVIVDWESFENYPWPKITDIDFFPLEYVSKHLPEGMGISVSHAGGLFEHVSQLISYEKLCYMVYDAPDLVQAVCDRIGSLFEEFYRQVIDFPRVYAVFPGDDMGFRSGLLMAPKMMREMFIPWNARYAKMAHNKRMLYFLHSCGDVYELMPDLIRDVSLNGKHSFEDVILPVEGFLKRYGNTMAALGGVATDTLSRSSPDEVRAYVSQKIERCLPYGRYAVGAGSSVTSYVPVENYQAMLETALQWS